jgi:hypothetical protein
MDETTARFVSIEPESDTSFDHRLVFEVSTRMDRFQASDWVEANCLDTGLPYEVLEGIYEECEDACGFHLYDAEVGGAEPCEFGTRISVIGNLLLSEEAFEEDYEEDYEALVEALS